MEVMSLNKTKVKKSKIFIRIHDTKFVNARKATFFRAFLEEFVNLKTVLQGKWNILI